ncbi:unnamed protein product [Lampetra fluviatilis]
MALLQLAITVTITIFTPLLLLLATWKLWEKFCLRDRDPSCPLPLPPGSMGLPLIGETLHYVLGRGSFMEMKRQRYGPVYRTHLFGMPTVRVTGSENVRRLLLGEHRLVAAQWPTSVRSILGAGCLSSSFDGAHRMRKKVILKAFSREALQNYVPTIVEEVSVMLGDWCSRSRPVLVYPEVKVLMFRIAMRLLLGIDVNGMARGEIHALVGVFEEMIRNLFSLPIEVPFGGLYRGLKARNVIHSKIEESIKKKLSSPPTDGCKDALQMLIEHSRENGNCLSLQDLKESATELLFGGHETTASAATSLVMHLAIHPHVRSRLRSELKQQGFTAERTISSLAELEELKFVASVVKETLRVSPPVAGGFRVALKTFEINGYQIPKGWNVIYSIKETHNMAENFPKRNDFDPDRWMTGGAGGGNGGDAASSRFTYIPFGGGSRSCVGKELARLILRIVVVELCRRCEWELPNGPPTLVTAPSLYPVDNLPARFSAFSADDWR